MIENPHLLPKVRSRALLDAVQYMPCALRVSSFVPGHKCAPQETVVGCHLDRSIGKGIGTKVSDLYAIAACSNCHDILDGRDNARRDFILAKYPTAYLDRVIRGLTETQARWVDMGLLEGQDWEIVR